MDSISLKMPVTVKAKLTEKLKNKLMSDMDEGIKQAQLEIQQINIEEQRLLKENDSQTPTPQDIQRLGAIREHYAEERNKRMQYTQETTSRKENLEKLALGAEIVQGTLERQVEVHVGDDMRELMNVEILVEDDKIVAIRG